MQYDSCYEQYDRLIVERDGRLEEQVNSWIDQYTWYFRRWALLRSIIVSVFWFVVSYECSRQKWHYYAESRSSLCSIYFLSLALLVRCRIFTLRLICYEKKFDYNRSFQCKGYLSPHSRPMSIACCYEGNYCNKNITPPPYANVPPASKPCLLVLVNLVVAF